MYKTAIRPMLMYGNESRPITQKQESNIGAMEMRMLRYVYQPDWEDHITNDSIRQMA